MSIWDVLAGRWGARGPAVQPLPEPIETEEYRRAMAQARAAKERADRILATCSEQKTKSIRPAI